MKTTLFTFFVLFGIGALAQEIKKDPIDGCPTFNMPDGDTVWVMKQYMMVFYQRGPSRDQDSASAANIQAGHMAFINRMADEGFLSIAGPFADDTDLRGILIFNVPEQTKVAELMQQDPAVKSGRLTAEIHPWWGAKGSVLK